MKVAYQHEVTTSFVMWFDHFLLSKGEAYKNITSPCYHQVDDRLPDNTIFASPHKQWVTDSSIQGAQIPEGIYDDGVFVPRGTNGLKLDFENGRAILDSSFPTSANVTATFAMKDFNVYVTDQNEEDLIIESNLKINSRFFRENTGIPPYDHVVPAIFISNDGARNDPFAFGGEDKTTTYFKAAVIAENLYTLDGVLSIFNDASRTVFSKINFNDHPINEFGDLKYGLKTSVTIQRRSKLLFSGSPVSVYQQGGSMTVRSSVIKSGTTFTLVFGSPSSAPSLDVNQSTNNITVSYPRYNSDVGFGFGTDPSVVDVVNFINSQEGFTASHNGSSYFSTSMTSVKVPGLLEGTYQVSTDEDVTPPYNYKDLADRNKEDYFLIQSVSCSRMTDSLRKVVLDNLFVGFIDFEIAKNRFPRL